MNWFKNIKTRLGLFFNFDQVLILTTAVLISVLTLTVLITGIVFTELENGSEVSAAISTALDMLANIATTLGILFAAITLAQWKKERNADINSEINVITSECSDSLLDLSDIFNELLPDNALIEKAIHKIQDAKLKIEKKYKRIRVIRKDHTLDRNTSKKCDEVLSILGQQILEIDNFLAMNEITEKLVASLTSYEIKWEPCLNYQVSLYRRLYSRYLIAMDKDFSISEQELREEFLGLEEKEGHAGKLFSVRNPKSVKEILFLPTANLGYSSLGRASKLLSI